MEKVGIDSSYRIFLLANFLRSFFENCKKVSQFFGENALNVAIYIFFAILGDSRRKRPKNYSTGAFFHALLIKCLLKCPNFKKLPCPEKLLVTCLSIHNNYETLKFKL